MDDRREQWLREYWPLAVGAVIIIVGNIYFYGVQGADWMPAGPAFLVALVVVIVLELGRSVYHRVDGDDESS